MANVTDVLSALQSTNTILSKIQQTLLGGLPVLPALTNGQTYIGQTGASPAAATIGAGNGIAVTTGSGTLSVATNFIRVMQTVSGTSTGSTTSSGTFVDVTGATLSVTPSSTSSKILVLYSAFGTAANVVASNNFIQYQLVSTASNPVTNGERSLGSFSAGGGDGAFGSVAWTYLESPASVAAQTYKIQQKSSLSQSITTSAILMVLVDLLTS